LAVIFSPSCAGQIIEILAMRRKVTHFDLFITPNSSRSSFKSMAQIALKNQSIVCCLKCICKKLAKPYSFVSESKIISSFLDLLIDETNILMPLFILNNSEAVLN